MDIDNITLEVVSFIHDMITTSQIDEETARIAANNTTDPNSIKLASVIAIDSH